jgi:Na+/H+ antiporter NhaD/arsenite permease-like protein
MTSPLKFWLLVAILLTSIIFLLAPPPEAQANDHPASLLLVGVVDDMQDVPVAEALVTLEIPENESILAEGHTQEDGRFTLALPQPSPAYPSLQLRVERSHFKTELIRLETAVITQLNQNQTVVLPTITLARQISLAFWVASAVFIGMLAIIALSEMHNTLIALAAAMLIFLVTYLGSPFWEGLFIFNFETALTYVDWDVIFLIMGMMMFIAVVERTGVFQWLAFASYRLSGGRIWLLLIILMFVTGVASAFLDNVTTMLLMTPISVQIALMLGLNPLTLLIPEVMASNVIGVSTLVGTPTNILIGSFGNISFNDFLINLTPGVLLAFVGLVLYSLFFYRQDLRESNKLSPRLVRRLEASAQIAEPAHLKKAAWVGAFMLILFVVGESIHLVPAVTALMGATVLLLWIRPNVEEMIDAVDWTTLVFFIALFIVVGAIQEVGLISMLAAQIGNLVDGNLLWAMLAIIWLGAILSTVVANIPFTAAMLPVVGFLSSGIPGAGESKVLFYCLSVGSAMGGNGSLIGASANLVTAGIAERAGYPITYGYFLRKGFPALCITVGLATLWLLYRFWMNGG